MTARKRVMAWGIKYSNGRMSKRTYAYKDSALDEHNDVWWGDGNTAPKVVRVEILEVKCRRRRYGTMILPLEQQVCSLESAKRLKELGVRQDSHYSYGLGNLLSFDQVEEEVTGGLIPTNEVYSAYTVAELGSLLKWNGFTKKRKDRHTWNCYPDMVNANVNYMEADTEAEARAKMLIYLKEKNLI